MIKTLPYSILLLLCLGGFSLSAQITITADNFSRSATFTDTIYKSTSTTGLRPEEGEDILWDYSDLLVEEISVTNYIEADASSDIPAAFSYYNSDLVFQGFIISNFDYEGIDDMGWYEHGRSTQESSYSITAISGGANDSLKFIDHVIEYDEPFYNILYPATYGSTWSQTSLVTTPFQLTVEAFGLSNTPGEQRRIYTQSRDIVGYGNLIIPDENGNPSPEMEVLLIKKIRTGVDSFYLGGSPAPPPIMSAFGLTQGSIVTDTSYLFYKADFGSPVISYFTDDDFLYYRPRAASTVTSIRDLELVASKAFPNPIRSGQSLNIQSEHLDNPFAINITDINGRIVYSASLENALTENGINVKLPTHLNGGNYFYNIIDYRGNLLTIGKLIIL